MVVDRAFVDEVRFRMPSAIRSNQVYQCVVVVDVQ